MSLSSEGTDFDDEDLSAPPKKLAWISSTVTTRENAVTLEYDSADDTEDDKEIVIIDQNRPSPRRGQESHATGIKRPRPTATQKPPGSSALLILCLI